MTLTDPGVYTAHRRPHQLPALAARTDLGERAAGGNLITGAAARGRNTAPLGELALPRGKEQGTDEECGGEGECRRAGR